MKNNILMRIIAIALVAMSIMAISIPAMAATFTLAPGASNKYLYNISATPSYHIYFSDNVPDGSIVQIRLDLNDLYDLDSNGNPKWKKAATATLVKGGQNSVTISPDSHLFSYVSGRSSKARIKFTASTLNPSLATVVFPN